MSFHTTSQTLLLPFQPTLLHDIPRYLESLRAHISTTAFILCRLGQLLENITGHALTTARRHWSGLLGRILGTRESLGWDETLERIHRDRGLLEFCAPIDYENCDRMYQCQTLPESCTWQEQHYLHEPHSLPLVTFLGRQL